MGNGGSCDEHSDCSSGHCQNGFCCSSGDCCSPSGSTDPAPCGNCGTKLRTCENNFVWGVFGVCSDPYTGYSNNCDSTNGCVTRTSNGNYNMCNLNTNIVCGLESLCNDDIDNDCDGTSDYDNNDGLKADSDCKVQILSADVSKSDPDANSNIDVYCRTNAAGVNSVFVFVDYNLNGQYDSGEDCGWPAGSGWGIDGKATDVAVFKGCPVGVSGSKQVYCSVYDLTKKPTLSADKDRSYQDGGDVSATILVRPTECSHPDYASQASCRTDICKWVDQCSGISPKYSGGNGRCIAKNSVVSYSCSVYFCGDQCDSSTLGACADNTCSEVYSDSCNGKKLVEYDDDKLMDSTTVENSCQKTCQLGSCLCADCSPSCPAPSTNSYCVKGVCGAECDEGDQYCDDECVSAILDVTGTVTLHSEDRLDYDMVYVRNGGKLILETADQLIVNYDMVIYDGGTVTHSGNGALNFGTDINTKNYFVNIKVNGDMTIENGGKIDVTGMGFAGGYGPGAGTVGYPQGGGAGYGGVGGTVYSGLGGSVYGSVQTPFALGSGGAPSRIGSTGGGGYVFLDVDDTLLIGGDIISNGGSDISSGSGACVRDGGGSGGSIQIHVDYLQGTGKIQANGGSSQAQTTFPCNTAPYSGGGGGGGRIALHYANNAFSGTVSVNGGTGYAPGGKGSIYPCFENSQCPSGFFCDPVHVCQVKLVNGEECTTYVNSVVENDAACISGNCDADYDSADKYCHATSSSCPDGVVEYIDGYILCTLDDWYKTCNSGLWSAQVTNPDTENNYCDADGGVNSGYDLAATCTNGIGFNDPFCISCEPYIAQSVDGCKIVCSVDTDCWDSYHCDGTCISDVVNGVSCDKNSDCLSDHCQNGFCCASGDCCSQVADCPSSYSIAPNCDSAGTCQGTRVDRDCSGNQCVGIPVPDDSACASSTLSDNCGLFIPVYCSGAVTQNDPVCLLACTDDNECDAGAHCDDICMVDVVNGGSCDENSDCLSGHCQNGFCCASGDCCSQATDCPSSYVIAPKCDSASTCQGTRVDRVCSGNECVSTTVPDDSACTLSTLSDNCGLFIPVYCSGAVTQNDDTACLSACTNDNQCDSNVHCDDGTCVLDVGNGESCDENSDCSSGHCQNDFCCASGDCCSQAIDCPDDENCRQITCNNNLCNCVPKLENGAGCIVDNDCISGNCDADRLGVKRCHATSSNCINDASGVESINSYSYCPVPDSKRVCSDGVWQTAQSCFTDCGYYKDVNLCSAGTCRVCADSCEGDSDCSPEGYCNAGVCIACTNNELSLCADGYDNDCDGESDWDKHVWQNNVQTASAKDSHGDDDCAVSVAGISVSDNFPVEETSISVFCAVSVSGVDSVAAYVDSNLCTFPENGWNGPIVEFHCNVGAYTGVPKIVECRIDDSKSYVSGTAQTTQINVRTSDCTNYGTYGECQDPNLDCEWCSRCNPLAFREYSGGNDRCVLAGECASLYECVQGQCGADCDGHGGVVNSLCDAYCNPDGKLVNQIVNPNSCNYDTCLATDNGCTQLQTVQPPKVYCSAPNVRVGAQWSCEHICTEEGTASDGIDAHYEPCTLTQEDCECNTYYYDINNDILTDGCEYFCIVTGEESCDGLDNDCDGLIDEDESGVPLSRACYTGLSGTKYVGVCHGGVESCAEGGWNGNCAGQVVPSAENCADGLDNDCDSKTDCKDDDCAGQIDQAGNICCQDNGNCASLDAVCADGLCNVQNNFCEQQFLDSNTVCRVVAGVCDVAESCNGNSADCPVDLFKPTTERCDDNFLCSSAGDDGYNSEYNVPSRGYCDGLGNCDSGSIVADACDLAEGTLLEGSGLSICVDGEQACIDSCTDGVNNDEDACTDGADADCGGTETVCDDDVDNDCDGNTDEYDTDCFECVPGQEEFCGSGDCQGTKTCLNGFWSDCTTRGTDCGLCCTCEDNNEPVPAVDLGQDDECPVFNCDGLDTICVDYSPVQYCKGIDECADNVQDDCNIFSYAQSTTVCRASEGTCDPEESCTGSSGVCPVDIKLQDVCRPSEGDCDVVEYCDGSNDDCPVDAVQTQGFECREKQGVCDVIEYCDGTSVDCPTDLKSDAMCRDSQGVCDILEYCDGSGNDCPADQDELQGVECRGAVSNCDIAEECTGSGPECPEDLFKPTTEVCNSNYLCSTGGDDGYNAGSYNLPSQAYCDGNGNCDYASVTEDACSVSENAAVEGSELTVCVDGEAACVETCTDGINNDGDNCLDSDDSDCGATETQCSDGLDNDCDGNTDEFDTDCFECVPGVSRYCGEGACEGTQNCVSGFWTDCTTKGLDCGLCCVCEDNNIPKPQADLDQDDECPIFNCDGLDTICVDYGPVQYCKGIDECADNLQDDCNIYSYENTETVCRFSEGVCDPEETCTGESGECPVDSKSTGVCKSSEGDCDVIEYCDGINDDCPIDMLKGSEVECRGSAGACDIVDYCTGFGSLCPADVKSTEMCRADSGKGCDVAEYCDGNSNNCPDNGYKIGGTMCRAAADNCDIEESCDGLSDVCPVNAFQPTTHECNPDYLCSRMNGGDNAYDESDFTLPSKGYCDGLGNCDYAITLVESCSSAENGAYEGAEISVCVDGQANCVATCTDGYDNDNDGCEDDADSDCGGTETYCSDGVDNDCDGKADCMDTDCVGQMGSNSVLCCNDAAICPDNDCRTLTCDLNECNCEEKYDNGAECSVDNDCTSGNCDPDFDSEIKYCHQTETSCTDNGKEYPDGYELCYGSNWYKTCVTGVWSFEIDNPDTSKCVASYWKLDEGQGAIAFDAAGDNDLDITAVGWYNNCVYGTCLDFTGNTGGVVGGVTDLDILSVEYWFRPEMVYDLSTLRITYATDKMFEIYMENADVVFNYYGYETSVSYNNWDTDQWYYVLATFDGSQSSITLCDNCECITAQTTEQTSFISKSNVLILGGSDDDLFKGLMDEIRIYNRVISLEEATSNCQDYCPDLCDLDNTLQQECVNGECGIVTCSTGFVDLNYNPLDGCEYACLESGDEICDGLDNDCNGNIDEGFDENDCEEKCAALGGSNYDNTRTEICCGDNPNEAGPYETDENVCNDGSDNDCDSFIDCEDLSCDGLPGPGNEQCCTGTANCPDNNCREITCNNNGCGCIPKLENGVACDIDHDCLSDNCDADIFGVNRCHEAADSCINNIQGTETLDGGWYCLDFSTKKQCINAVWQQNTGCINDCGYYAEVSDCDAGVCESCSTSCSIGDCDTGGYCDPNNECVVCTDTEESMCDDGRDNDCDGRIDYDMHVWDNGVPTDTLKETRGDNDCLVEVTELTVSDITPVEDTVFSAYCKSTVAGVDSIDVFLDGVKCSWRNWQGNMVEFECNPGAYTGVPKIVECKVDEVKSEVAGSSKILSVNVMSSDCAAYPDEPTCEVPETGCEWCLECFENNPREYTGGENRCVPENACAELAGCSTGQCGATCDQNTGVGNSICDDYCDQAGILIERSVNSNYCKANCQPTDRGCSEIITTPPKTNCNAANTQGYCNYQCIEQGTTSDSIDAYYAPCTVTADDCYCQENYYDLNGDILSDGCEYFCIVSGEEICDGEDNDCDGLIDEDEFDNPLARTCYTGLDGTENVGLCYGGIETCTGGDYSVCENEVTPVPEICGDTFDNDCDGAPDCTDSECATEQGPDGAVCCQVDPDCILFEDDCAVGVCNLNTNICEQQFLDAMTVCGIKDGECDVAEFCSGFNSECPLDTFKASDIECRVKDGVCDKAELCTGTGPYCPVDVFEGSDYVCNAAAGLCDILETCTGLSKDCPVDVFLGADVECRAKVANCDVAELCQGDSPVCPYDEFKPEDFECRGIAGDCDVPETCTGTSAFCPEDMFKNPTVECREKSGDCDIAETCTGANAQCPDDSLADTDVECRAKDGDCDVAEICTGVGKDCPVDAFEDTNYVCKDIAGPCDVVETCTGLSKDCPVDEFLGDDVECRAKAADCDVAELCQGDSPVCPSDEFKPEDFECRGIAGDCDLPEICTGTSAFCPEDMFKNPIFECRVKSGDCDIAETCTGANAQCPDDSLADTNVECRAKDGDCDVAETCTGVGKDCSVDGYEGADVVCREAVNDCDIVEKCTGLFADCPADIFEPVSKICDSTYLCSIAGDNGYDSANYNCPSMAYCDGYGNCDHAVTVDSCDLAENAVSEGTGLTVCVDGESICVDTCADSISNDIDLCVDGADSDCGGTETGCDNGIDDDCDGLLDRADFNDCNQVPIHQTPLINSTFGTNYTYENLICHNVSTNDPNNELVINYYTWFKDGLLKFTVENLSILLAGNTSEGDNWSCAVTPYDYKDYGETMYSQNLTIKCLDLDNDKICDASEPVNCRVENTTNLPPNESCVVYPGFDYQTGCWMRSFNSSMTVLETIPCEDTLCKIYPAVNKTCNGAGGVITQTCAAVSKPYPKPVNEPCGEEKETKCKADGTAVRTKTNTSKCNALGECVKTVGNWVDISCAAYEQCDSAQIECVCKADSDQDGVCDGLESVGCIGQAPTDTKVNNDCITWTFNTVTGCWDNVKQPSGEFRKVQPSDCPAYVDFWTPECYDNTFIECGADGEQTTYTCEDIDAYCSGEADASQRNCALYFDKNIDAVKCNGLGHADCWIDTNIFTDRSDPKNAEKFCCGDDGDDECWAADPAKPDGCCYSEQHRKIVYINEADDSGLFCNRVGEELGVRDSTDTAECDETGEEYCFASMLGAVSQSNGCCCCGDDEGETWSVFSSGKSLDDVLVSGKCENGRWVSRVDVTSTLYNLWTYITK
ncbi:MAG: LamG-like jellyroll fold domain-containing protein [Nanoarchaeota archaeon]